MADPIRQLLSQTSYDADGTTTVWNFSFAGGYLDREHVKVQVMDKVTLLVTQIPISDANFIGDYQLQLVPAIEVGQELTIYRDSPKDLPLVDFADRAALTEVALDLNAKQAIFASAEVTDTVNTSLAAVSQVGAQVAAAEGYAEDAAGHAADAANQVLLATAKATQATASAAASSNSAQDASDFAAAAAASAESVDTAFLLNRANHTGTQDASTVTVSGSPLPTVLGQKADTSAMNAAISTASTADRGRANHTGTQSVSTLTGVLPVANGGTGAASSTGSGNVVLSTSPSLEGVPTAPTAAANTSTTQIASTEFTMTALNARQRALGDGQTFQVMGAARAPGVTYTNSTGRTIFVTVRAATSAANTTLAILLNGITAGNMVNPYTSGEIAVSLIVPDGANYRVNEGAGATTNLWRELR